MKGTLTAVGIVTCIGSALFATWFHNGWAAAGFIAATIWATACFINERREK